MSKKRRKTPERKTRPTIGYLAPAIYHTNYFAQWSGVIDAAQEHDVNLLCFPGWSLRDPRDFQAQANVLYDLAGAENLDGMVTWASSIGNYVDADEIRAFHERYRPLPVVTIGRTGDGFPGLLMDSYKGMHEAVVHLIEVHGCRRLAFIRGPEGHFYAQERYRAYAEALEAHGIPLDPDLITPPFNWSRSTGVEVMRMLLDERKLRPQTDFEAVVSANDDLGLGAMDVLQARGIRVPGDVAIAGFNDTVESKTSTPPLTTVTVPFYEVGYRATEMLLALVEGEEVAEETVLPSRLVVRHSCGCESTAVVQAAAGAVKASQEGFEAVVTAQREEILTGIAQGVRELGGSPEPAWAERLLDGFAAEMGGGPVGAFLAALDEILRQVVAAGGDVSAWHGALSALRHHLLPCLDGKAQLRADDLWQQGRVAIGERVQRVQAYRQLQVEQQTQTLREIGASLITTFDVGELMDVLAERLPGLGIPSCYLALYEDPKPYEYPQPAPEWSQLALACNEKGRVELEPGGRRFPSRQLVPEGFLPQERQYSLVVQPLYLRQSQAGFVLFEIGPREGIVYATLGTEISSALYGARLIQQVESRALQLQTASEVSRAASGVLDPDELIQQTVDLVQERFNLYYAGLFLVDETGEWAGEPGRWAVLRAGTGRPGRQMVARGHKLEIGGTSMIGWCVANKQARIALDVGEEAVRFENPLLPETRSELALPLISRGEAIGALTIQSTQEAAFSEGDIAVLQTMADQLANAIQNVHLFEEAHIRAEESAALTELGRALAGYLTVQEVLAEVHRGASRLLDATNFYIALYDPDEDVVTFPFDTTQEEDDKFLALPANQGITGHIIRHRTSVLIEENVPERLAEIGVEMIGKPCLSWLGVPMMIGGQVLGVIGVQSFVKPRAYGEHDRELLTAIATQAAIAIQNARLFEEARARAEQEQFVRTVTDRIRRTADREDIMRIAAQELSQALGASRSVVRLGTQDQLLASRRLSARKTEES